MGDSKSTYWECAEAAVIGYLMHRVGDEVSIGEVAENVPAVSDRPQAAMVVAQLTHERRLVWDGKKLVSVD